MPGLCVLPDPKRTRRHGGYLSWLFPRCKISPKLNGTAPTSGMKCSRWYFLFATWMAVGRYCCGCLQHGTAVSLFYERQRIRHGGCFPIEDFIDGFWRQHRSMVIFNYCNCTRVSSPQRQHRYQYNAGCQYPRDVATCMTKPEMISTCNSLPFLAFTNRERLHKT